MENIVDVLKFDEKGLVPAIVQDVRTGEILMMAYMNKESFLATVETGKATFWSRSRQKFWIKGETSGNIQEVKEICVDCDGDTLLLKVIQYGDNGKNENGAACHTGYKSCFYRVLKNKETWEERGEKLFDPDQVYKK